MGRTLKEVERERSLEGNIIWKRNGHDRKRICGGQRHRGKAHAPTSGTLHMLFPLLRMLPLDMQVAHPLTFLSGL